MDNHVFDEITRKMAAGSNRRSVLRGLIGGGAVLFGLKAASTVAEADKTTICHQTSSATNPWEAITVANSSLPAHYAHGDFAYGDCCNDSECASGICEKGTCAPVKECPPFTTWNEKECVTPCSVTECHCSTEPQYKGICMATVSGDAICVPVEVVEKGGSECKADTDCKIAELACVARPGSDVGVCLPLKPDYCAA